MANIAKVAEVQKSLEVTFSKRMDELEKKFHMSSSQGSYADKIQVEFKDFKAFVTSMFELLRQQISALNGATDNIEMRHRRKFLLLSGVPETDKEDVKSTVAEVVISKLKLEDFSASSLKACHRLGNPAEGRNRPIVFRTFDQSLRTSIWQRKTMLKGSTFVISEFLTRRRQHIFMEARTKFGMKNVWTLDGTVFVKLPGGSRSRITSPEDLEKLLSEQGEPGTSANKFTTSKSPKPTVVSKVKRTIRSKQQ